MISLFFFFKKNTKTFENLIFFFEISNKTHRNFKKSDIF